MYLIALIILEAKYEKQNPASQNSLKSGNILFNYGSNNFVINTLTREYGGIGDGFTFEDYGTMGDKVKVCYGKDECRTFEFDNEDQGETDKKSALALQEWMEEKIGYGKEESKTTEDKKEGLAAAELIGKYK